MIKNIIKKLKLIFILVIASSSLAQSQEKLIEIELSPIVVNFETMSLSGLKTSVPIYFKEKISISPYFLMEKSSLNAYDTYRNYYNDIAPAVFNSLGLKVNKDFTLNEKFYTRISAGFNCSVITNNYFGEKISIKYSPTIDASLIWRFSVRFAMLLDLKLLKFVYARENDGTCKYIESNNLINGELGEYNFSGEGSSTINFGLVILLKSRSSN